VKRLQAMMTFHKAKADIAVHDARPRRPTRSKQVQGQCIQVALRLLLCMHPVYLPLGCTVLPTR
jgi:hypothetical protein